MKKNLNLYFINIENTIKDSIIKIKKKWNQNSSSSKKK